MDKNLQQRLFSELRLLLEPLIQAGQSEGRKESIFRSLGWEPTQIENFPNAKLSAALTDLVLASEDLQSLIDGPPDDLKQLADALLLAGHTARGVIALSDLYASGTGPAGIEALGQELLDFLAVSYLSTHHRVVYHLARVLTVVDDVVAPLVLSNDQEVIRAPLYRPTLRLAQISRLITDPIGTLKGEYGLQNGIPIDPNPVADKLFPRIAGLVDALGGVATYGYNPAYKVGFDFGPGGDILAAHSLTVFVPTREDEQTYRVGFGTAVSLSHELGTILRPLGAFEVDERLGKWRLRGKLVVQAEGVAVDSAGVQIPAGSTGGINLAFSAARVGEPGPDGNALGYAAGSTTGTRLEIGDFTISLDANLAPGALDYGFLVGASRSRLVLAAGDGDGLIRKIFPKEVPIDFDLSIGWSKLKGLRFGVSAGLDIRLPVHISIAKILDIDDIQLAIRAGNNGISLLTTATFTAHLGGAVDITAQETGLKAEITFPPDGGNLGPLQTELRFQLPRGIGVSIHAGPVEGGGFIYLDPEAGRYSGALELQIYSIGVKAFGLIETKFPDGREGYSFVIVIVAEFTPIQLGFGFTLLGVGGLVGINRTMVGEALGAAVRSGSLENVLFPRDVVRNAPAIINSLATIFPAAPGHYVFGPMAKLGWGTPTLVTAELGIILELPGPRLAVIGTVHVTLPTVDSALARFNLAIAGVLDFPKKLFSLDGSLYDSQVGGFAVAGDMAFRLNFGNRPNFALSIGGFSPAFEAPASFPKLRRISVSLGINGNPSLTKQGYFALTSNTAQVGASVDLYAEGAGIELRGHLGYDALFIFSPFSFVASFDASVRVSFHDVGIGVHLHGEISGPSPWRIRGEACVSVLWWDACLSFDATFGRAKEVKLPAIDPWEGKPKAAPTPVIGLRPAIEDSRNWSGAPAPAAFAVVSVAKRSDASTPVDPMGAATLRQKAVPLNRKLTKFGEYAPAAGSHNRFNLSSVLLAGVEQRDNLVLVDDDFAPAQFKEMSASERLSAPAYEKMTAGFTISPDLTSAGAVSSGTITYRTQLLGAAREPVGPVQHFTLPKRHLLGMLLRSAAAQGGVRQGGLERYVNPLTRAKVRFGRERFAVATSCGAHATTLPNMASEHIANDFASYTDAALAIEDHLAAFPKDAGRYLVLRRAELAA